ncbi:MAG: hypothetical protein M1582_04290 [Actinobacteria bacterium]|nr:hypothetical protein [Actinomycetota bacterium]
MLLPEPGGPAGHNAQFFGLAGLTVRVQADLPPSPNTFGPSFDPFRLAGPAKDVVSLHHHFSVPDLCREDLGERVYRHVPWEIRRREDSWVYLGISPGPEEAAFHQVAVFSRDHSAGRIFHRTDEYFRAGNLEALTMFPTDQIWLARVLADRRACYIHSAGMVMDGQGLLFVGHSEAGKSTTVTMLRSEGEILCDDRIVVRRWPEGFRIHGTWSHGDVPVVSSASAPLRAILFIEQAPENRLVPIQDRREVVKLLPFYVVKPLVTADWWQKTLDLVGEIAREVPAYRLRLDRSGQVISVLKQLLAG